MSPDLHELTEWLERFVAQGSTVTITRTDGKVYTGTLVPDPVEPRAYRVRTGRRGRPAIVWPEDVQEVTAE